MDFDLPNVEQQQENNRTIASRKLYSTHTPLFLNKTKWKNLIDSVETTVVELTDLLIIQEIGLLRNHGNC